MSDVREIEQDIRKSEEAIEFGKALERLRDNKDFKLIIEQAYLRDEAVRLVHLRADPAMESPLKQAAIIRDIDAIGSLVGFLRNIESSTSRAFSKLEQDRAELQFALTEGDE